MAEDNAELSLEDLKKENEAAEAAEAAKLAAAEEESTETDDDELEADTSDDDSADDDSKDDDKDKDPPADDAWMATEEDSPDKELKFTDGDAGAIRKKYKGRVAEKDVEIDGLRQEIEALKKQKPAAAAMKDKPKRDDFETDDEFLEALVDYREDIRDKKNQASNASAAQKQALDLRNKEVNKDVDNHYVRAHALATKSNITPETYHAADLRVRRALEELFPKDGDAICDTLISITGEGSEKVFYHLGVNPTKLDRFIELLRNDKNGMAASSYLGQLKAELAVPVKRTTKAPAPGEEIQGDKRVTVGNKNLLKQYKAAHKANEGQKAFNIKQKAKAAGVDVKSW